MWPGDLRNSTLPFPLLYTVFPEVPHSCLKGFTNLFSRMRLGNPDQRNLLGAPPGALSGSGYPLVQSRQIVRNCRQHELQGDLWGIVARRATIR